MNVEKIGIDLEIQEFADRLNKAIVILHNKYHNFELAPLIAPQFPGKNFSTGYLSKLRKPHKYPHVSAPVYIKVFKALDPIINKEFQYFYNAEKNSYYYKSQEESENFRKNDKRLEGLSGNWKGYSFDKKQSENLNVNYFNIFKLKISENNFVECQTEKTEFTGKISSVTERCIFFELSSVSRKIYLLGEISTRDQLDGIDRINLTYIDTGAKLVKCGLAIIKKFKGEYKDIAKPLSYPVHAFQKEDLDDIDQNFLLHTQHISPEYD